MAKASKAATRYEVTVTKDGKAYKGTYWVESGCVTVTAIGPDAQYLKKATQLGGSSAETLARTMLSEFVQSGQLG